MKIDTIAKQLLFSTVRIETINDSQNTTGVGTSFIFSLELEETKHATFLITNKHVVEGASRGRFFFARKTGEEPAMGERVQIQWDKFEERWYKHPEPEIDIAAMPIVPTMKKLEELGQDIFFRHITDKMALRTEWLEDLDALEEIMFVGYPSGIYDEVNLLPIIRKGVTATPLHVDYNGKPIFLIDASVFPGSSGSPVFIYNPSGFGTNKSFTIGISFHLFRSNCRGFDSSRNRRIRICLNSN